MVQPSLQRVRHLAKARPRAIRHGVPRVRASERGLDRRTGALIRTGVAGPDHPQRPQPIASGHLKALVFAP
jgi:hypothetical protein